VATVIVTASADRDTHEIVAYLARRGGPPSIRKYLKLFDQVYERLMMFPGSGHPRAKLGPLVRIAVVSPFLIIHEWDPAADTVTILRIVRSRRRITQKLVRG
jgi:toxin ParE1/3/4